MTPSTPAEINAKLVAGAEALVQHVKELSDENPMLAIGMLLVAACSLSKHIQMPPEEFMKGVNTAYRSTVNDYHTYH